MTNDSGKKPVGQCGCTNGTCGICVNRMQVTPCANCERLESVNELYHELCHEWNETCSDGCSSWGHQEDCKMVHLAEVKKALQKQVADSRDYALKLQKQLEMCKEALEFYADNNSWIKYPPRPGWNNESDSACVLKDNSDKEFIMGEDKSGYTGKFYKESFNVGGKRARECLKAIDKDWVIETKSQAHKTDKGWFTFPINILGDFTSSPREAIDAAMKED